MKKGFTLVELLAVIVILGVLLLIAVPAVSTIITNSRKSADRNEAIEFLNQLENCTMAEKANQSVCTPSEVLNYMKSDKIGVRYGNDCSTNGTSWVRIQNGVIEIKSFIFIGSNKYMIKSTTDSDLGNNGSFISIDKMKDGIAKADNTYGSGSSSSWGADICVKTSVASSGKTTISSFGVSDISRFKSFWVNPNG